MTVSCIPHQRRLALAFLDDVFKGETIGAGLGVGLGMAILGPIVVPVFGAVVRPVAKSAIKLGMMAYDAAARGVSSAGGVAAGAAGGTGISSVFSEARAEVDAARTGNASERRPDTMKDRTTGPGSHPAAA